MSPTTDLRDLQVRALNMFNERELDAYYALFDPEVVYHGSDGDLHGPDALRARYDMALAFCPDLTIIQQAVAIDDVARTIASVQLERGTAVDGTAFGFEGLTFYRFGDNGLIVECWEHTRPLTPGVGAS